MIIGIDIETYSDISLPDCGLHRYTESPNFEILIIGYSVDGGDVTVIDCTKPDDGKLEEFKKLLFDPDVIKTAWNAAFERNCLAKWFNRQMPAREWRDTMIRALMCGLPGTLAGAGEAMGLPSDKQKDKQGKALIQFFSVPCKPTKSNNGRTRNLPQHDMDKWDLYLKYNKQDVVTEQEILNRLMWFSIPNAEQELWELDQQINDRGVKIDLNLVNSIVKADEDNQFLLNEESKDITKLDNPNSIAQLKSWLESKGVNAESITKDSVDAMLKSDIPDDVRRVLEIRKALGKTSVKKFYTMQQAVCSDGRIKGMLQFYGANRSGRWAGRLVQVHNLSKNYLTDIELARDIVKEGRIEDLRFLFGEPSFVFSELVRTAFIPSDGCRLVISDFSAIEARVLAWIAGEEWVLDAFREGQDIYCITASKMYKCKVDKHGENGHLRQKGKIAVLACGYQGSVGAMKAMDRSGSIPENELKSVVDDWRNANPHIVKLWYKVEELARRCLTEKINSYYAITDGININFYYDHKCLIITIPSGRSLCYRDAVINDKGRICYGGVNQTTKKWETVETYGGKLVENITQAIARDCLAEAMKRVNNVGYKIVMHIHDEMVVDVPEDDKEALDKINGMMADPIAWAPGLPLKGAGYEGKFYFKD